MIWTTNIQTQETSWLVSNLKHRAIGSSRRSVKTMTVQWQSSLLIATMTIHFGGQELQSNTTIVLSMNSITTGNKKNFAFFLDKPFWMCYIINTSQTSETIWNSETIQTMPTRQSSSYSCWACTLLGVQSSRTSYSLITSEVNMELFLYWAGFLFILGSLLWGLTVGLAAGLTAYLEDKDD